MNLPATISKMKSCDLSDDEIVHCLRAGTLADFIERLEDYEVDSSEIVDIVASYAGNAGLPARPPAPRRSNSSKMGPKERWGYDGPITPRLSEREWLPLRWRVLNRDEFICKYCGVVGKDEAQWCVDHVIPLSRGGSNAEDNLVACCVPCNNSKGDRLLSEWRGRYM